MEYFEGGSYRINIEGADSTLVLNSFTRSYVGNLVDAYGNVVFDYITGAINSPISGNLIATDGEIIIDVDNKTLLVNSIVGNLYSEIGKLSYNIETDTFIGDFNGNLVDDGGDVVLDVDRNLFLGNLSGDIYNSTGDKAYDSVTDTFSGTLVGSLVNAAGDVVLDVDRNLFLGNLSGDVYNNVGAKVYDSVTDTFSGTLYGNVVDDNNNAIVDIYNKSFYGNLIGDLYNSDLTKVYDSATDTFSGTFVGSLFDTDGNIIIDAVNKSIVGGLTGDLYNSTGDKAYDSITDTFSGLFNGDIIGSVIGNISNTDFLYYFNTTSGEIAAKSVEADEIQGRVSGTFTGQLMDSNGQIVFDTDSQILSNISLNGMLLSSNNVIAWDANTNVFTGSFNGNIIGDLLVENIISGENKSAYLAINTEKDMNDDYGGINLNVLKTSTTPGGIFLTRGRGTITAPEAVQPGDPLNCILFGGISEVNGNSKTTTPAAFIMTSAASDGTVNNTRINAEIKIGVIDDNGDAINALTINKDGNSNLTIKDLTVIGETGNTPSNTSTPTKWLEITVNGETVFMPLYA